MTAKNLLKLKNYLEDNGFLQKEGDRFHWDPGHGRSAHRLELPWQIADWSVEHRAGELHQQGFRAQMNADAFLQNFEELLKERFPSFRAIVLQPDMKGGAWLLLEFLDRELDADQSRIIEDDRASKDKLPHGLAGLHLSVIQALGQLSIFMTRHFFLGNTPGQLFIEFPRLLNKAIFGSALHSKTHFNAYLLTLASEELRHALVGFAQLPDELLKEEAETPPFRQTRLSFEDRHWNLDWDQGEDLPELLVPPIEILEQKEVARRFQRLDELILLEDYEGALQQCAEFLEKNPQSLYLIRRWAFLTLWAGKPFEQKFLDLMVKYDASNLMTMSLWGRKGLQEGQAEIVLENLSRLGSSLGQSVQAFETLHLTSLTLPEMLGDAWNQKDTQRAVECYERVLKARGEIPRILVKLIRLTRDIDDTVAEETYMDRLLACEVPTRTRAAIYFRLAEVKQRVNPSDACQWALRSWQTNRSQIRYALLAADLLIELQRPQDAVHVLVETSELIEASESRASRLALELKIATIWLSSMHRIDLAAERVARARELMDADPEALDTVLSLVEKFDDPALHLEVLEEALILADSNQDQERVARSIRSFIELGEATEDKKLASKIYLSVMRNALLSATFLESLVERQDLDLPPSEVLMWVEDRLGSLPVSEQGPYLLLLGDISVKRLDDVTAGQSYYERALEGGALHSPAFELLDATYSKNGQNTQRKNLLQKRLSMAAPAEKSLLLRELYYFDEGITDAEKDSYAVELLALETDDTGLFEERLEFYCESGHGESVIALFDALIAGVPLNPALGTLLRRSLSPVAVLENANRDHWVLQLLNKLKDQGADALEIAQLTIQHLWAAKDKNWIKSSLGLLVSRGEIPDRPTGEMLELLDDETLKVDLLLNLADRAEDFQAIMAYERQALALVRNAPSMSSIRLEIMTRLATKSEFSLGELEAFLRELEAQSQSSEQFRFLAAQLKLSSHDDHRRAVLKALSHGLESLTPDGEDEKAVLQALQPLDIRETAALRIQWFQRFGAHTEFHTDALLGCILQDASYWSDTDLLVDFMQLGLNQTQSKSRELINDFLCRLIHGRKDEILAQFLGFAWIQELLDARSLRTVTDSALQKKDWPRFEHFWTKSLKQLEQRHETIEFLQYSRRAFAQFEASQAFQDQLAELVALSSIENVEVAFEIQLFYAEMLLEANQSPRSALKQFELLHEQRPDEARVWGGLISLYKDLESHSELRDLLSKVLPSLKDDPRPLKEYQLTVSGLQKELEDLSARLSAKPQPAQKPQGFAELGTAAGTMPGLPSHPALPKPMTQANPVFELDDLVTVAKEASPATGDETVAAPTQFAWNESSQLGTAHALPAASGTLDVEGEGEASPFRLADASTHAGRGASVSLFEATSVFELPVPPPPASLDLVEGKPVIDVGEADVALDKQTLVSLPEDERASIEAAVQAFSLESPKRFPSLSEAWRRAAKQSQAEAGLLDALLSEPLADGAEQILAVQAMALLEDRTSTLSDYSGNVWRDPSAVNFEMKWSERMNRELFHPGLKSPLARLLKALYPIFIQHFAGEMGLSGVSDRLKMRADEILKIRRLIDWNDELIQRTSLKFYANSLAEGGYKIYHLPSIGDRFQFDFQKRDIYIDRAHYMSAPPTHLFHRLSFLMRAVSLDYFPFLHLSPGSETFPFLMKCKRTLEQTEGMKRVLGMEKDPLRMMLAQAKDRDFFAQLYGELGPISADRISQTVSHFIEQIYRLNLAESLDLIGVVETINGVDLSNPKVSAAQRLSQSGSSRSIMAFASELKFGGAPKA